MNEQHDPQSGGDVSPLPDCGHGDDLAYDADGGLICPTCGTPKLSPPGPSHEQGSHGW